jgi:phosphoribosylcarboxyaminoimidazole (NCAIR) mutase
MKRNTNEQSSRNNGKYLRCMQEAIESLKYIEIEVDIVSAHRTP